MTKGSILHKSCREVLHFCYVIGFEKKIFWYFQIWNFFFTGSSTLLDIWVTMREMSSFSKSLTKKGGDKWKKCYPPPSWLNPKISLIQSSSYCFAFWDIQYVFCIDIQKEPWMQENGLNKFHTTVSEFSSFMSNLI